MRPRRSFLAFILIVQCVVFLTHFMLYETWTFSPAGDPPAPFWLEAVLGLLSISFVVASLLAFRYTNWAVRFLYRAAAVWIGLVSFLFIAAIFSWVIFEGASVVG